MEKKTLPNITRLFERSSRFDLRDKRSIGNALRTHFGRFRIAHCQESNHVLKPLFRRIGFPFVGVDDLLVVGDRFFGVFQFQFRREDLQDILAVLRIGTILHRLDPRAHQALSAVPLILDKSPRRHQTPLSVGSAELIEARYDIETLCRQLRGKPGIDDRRIQRPGGQRSKARRIGAGIDDNDFFLRPDPGGNALTPS